VIITPALQSASAAISADEWMVLAQMGRESVLGELLARSSLPHAQTLMCLTRLQELGVVQLRDAARTSDERAAPTRREVVPASLLDRTPTVRRVVRDDADEATGTGAAAPWELPPPVGDRAESHAGASATVARTGSASSQTPAEAAPASGEGSTLHFGALAPGELELLRGAASGAPVTAPASPSGEGSTLHFGALATGDLEVLRGTASGASAAIAPSSSGESSTLHFGALAPGDLEVLRGAASGAPVTIPLSAPSESSTLHFGAMATGDLEVLRGAASVPTSPTGESSTPHFGAMATGDLEVLRGAASVPNSPTDESSTLHFGALAPDTSMDDALASDPSSWDWDAIEAPAQGTETGSTSPLELLGDVVQGSGATLHFAGATGPAVTTLAAATHPNTLHFAGNSTPIPALGAAGSIATRGPGAVLAGWAGVDADDQAPFADTLVPGAAVRPLLTRVDLDVRGAATSDAMSAGELGMEAFASIATPTGVTPAPPPLGADASGDMPPRTPFADAVLRDRLSELDRELAEERGMTPPPFVSERAQRAPPPVASGETSPGVAHLLESEVLSEALRQELQERESHAKRQDHFALLSIPRDADAAALKRAFHALSRRLHPDRFVHLGRCEERGRLERLYRRICDAYATLSDPDRRRAWSEAHPSLARPMGMARPTAPPRAPDAEQRDGERRSRLAQHPYLRRQVGVRDLIDRARSRLEAGDSSEAIELLSRARLEAPDEPEISALMARAREAQADQLSRDHEAQGEAAESRGLLTQALDAYRRAATLNARNGSVALRAARLLMRQGGELREARLFAQRAAELLPDQVEAQLLLAQVLIRTGARKLARKQLEEVLKLDPKHATARSQLLQLRFGL